MEKHVTLLSQWMKTQTLCLFEMKCARKKKRDGWKLITYTCRDEVRTQEKGRRKGYASWVMRGGPIRSSRASAL
jgi:hypothetical protein